MLCDRCDEVIPGLVLVEDEDYYRSFNDEGIQTLWYAMMEPGEEIICRKCASDPLFDIVAMKRRLKRQGYYSPRYT